jgi:NAD(P)-dependent dehydrogenase (short-subunit alcohol dehydrogenase family)
MGTLDNRVAIVTGSGQGIGRGIALALASEGALVTIAEIDEQLALATVAAIEERGGTALPFACNVRMGDEIDECVRATVDRFHGVNILVNSAMAARRGPLEHSTDDDLQFALATGPGATLGFMRACFPYLEGDGRVINLRSGSELQGTAGFGTYVAGKSAIAGLTKVAAREWGPRGITVNAICPFAASPGMEAYFSNPERLEQALASRSIKRVGDPERDIGRAAVFLAGPDSAYITGSTLMVDGGGDFLG